MLLDPEHDIDLRPDGCVHPRVGLVPHVPDELLEGDISTLPQVSEVEPENAGVGPHGRVVKPVPEPQISKCESEARGAKMIEVHKHEHNTPGDDEVKVNAHQELSFNG